MAKTYEDGRQDGLIDAIQNNCDRQVKGIHDRLGRIETRIVHLAGKVNHIYGGAVVLAAVVTIAIGIVKDIVVPLLVALLT